MTNIRKLTMKITNILVIALAIVGLSGCSWFTSPINVNMEPIDKPNLVLPDADEVRMRDVEWILITPENAEAVFEELRNQGNSVVLFGLTSDGYENIALNLSDIRAFLQQQQSIIGAYKSYHDNAEQAIDDKNKEIKELKDQED